MESNINGDVFESACWPGNKKRILKGWAMLWNAKPIIIGVPGRTTFAKFVEVADGPDNRYTNFYIYVFQEMHRILFRSYPQEMPIFALSWNL